MSAKDLEILERLELSQRDLAVYLEVSPAAVSKGLHSGGDYLDISRLRRLSRGLQVRDPGKSKILDEIVLSRYGAEGVLADPQRLRFDDRPEQGNFKEMWVVSRRPREMQEIGYFERMLNEHLACPDKTILYFLPPNVAGELSRDLKAGLPSNHANIQVFAVENLVVCPHYVIFEPRSSEKIRGLIRADVYGFVALQREEVVELALNLQRLLLHQTTRQTFPEGL